MKSGSILVQVLISTAISAILSTALFTAFYQTNQTLNIVDDYVDIYAQAALINKQFEQDISGAMIPFEPPKEEKKSPEPVKKDTGQEKKVTPVTMTKKEKPPKPIKKIFYGVNKDKNLDILTFITNNPLRIYWGKQTGKPKPSIARVVYRLQKEKGQPSFKLMRQESSELDFNKFKPDVAKPIKAYELAHGIKELSLEYTAEVTKAGEGKDKKKDEQSKKEKEYKVFKKWDLEEQEKKEQKQKLRKVPHGVKIKVILWDDQRKREREFIFAIPILPNVEPIAIKATQEQPKPPVKKPQQTQQQMQAQVQRQLNSRNQILSFGVRR